MPGGWFGEEARCFPWRESVLFAPIDAQLGLGLGPSFLLVLLRRRYARADESATSVLLVPIRTDGWFVCYLLPT
jgi:hypothetical protein